MIGLGARALAEPCVCSHPLIEHGATCEHGGCKCTRFDLASKYHGQLNAQGELIRLGRWAMRGHVPPFPPDEAPPEMHNDACKLCGENEYQRRRTADAKGDKASGHERCEGCRAPLCFGCIGGACGLPVGFRDADNIPLCKPCIDEIPRRPPTPGEATQEPSK